MVSLLICTGFDARLTIGGLILLNRQSEKPQAVKSKVLSACFESWISSTGVTRIGTGKEKESEGGEGRRKTTLFHNGKLSV